MTKSQVKKYLSTLFVPRAADLKGNAFRSEYMDKAHAAHSIYQAVSEAQRLSDLTHDFSYEISERAVDALLSADNDYGAKDWNDDDNLQECTDGQVPCYTGELMEIFQSNSWAVDEAVNEFGHGENSTSDAGLAWERQIQQMAFAIRTALNDLIDNSDDE